jgi:hypothetical protein
MTTSSINTQAALERKAITQLTLVNGSADADGHYATKLIEFKAVIKLTLEAGNSYDFVYCKEEKDGLFDSSMISRADVLATVFEDTDLAYKFADTYDLNLVAKHEAQAPIMNKAIEILADIFAVDEAQAYCAELAEAA